VQHFVALLVLAAITMTGFNYRYHLAQWARDVGALLGSQPAGEPQRPPEGS
jgi:hypothetical protein